MINSNQKVFGLGLSKTGTSSLTEALNQLGIKTIHYPSDSLTLRQLQEQDYTLKIMDDYQGATDISVATFYAQLDEAFPYSKFILTVRDKDSWLQSCQKHWSLMEEWIKNFPEVESFQAFISQKVYGTLKFDAEKFSAAYDRHVETVRKYFKKRPSQFLEMNICAGAGWDELCHFLECEIPQQPFPHANEWMHLVMLAEDSIRQTVPAGSRLLLIDQMGFGSGLAKTYQIVPFCQKNGVYWGMPADDSSAVAELKRNDDNQIEFVVVGFPCFWIFDFYPNFCQLLYNRFEIVKKNDAVVVLQALKSKTDRLI